VEDEEDETCCRSWEGSQGRFSNSSTNCTAAQAMQNHPSPTTIHATLTTIASSFALLL
jgi:hypothetical protein